MKAHYLGHVVFYVKNLEQSLAFYRVLGQRGGGCGRGDYEGSSFPGRVFL